MWKISWLYEKVHNFLVVPLYYIAQSFFKGASMETLKPP